MLSLAVLFQRCPPHTSVPSALDYSIELIEAVSDSFPQTSPSDLRIRHHLAQTILILKAFRKLHRHDGDITG